MKFIFLILFGILLSNCALTQIKAQTGISLSTGVMEHYVGVPGFRRDVFHAIPLKLVVNHYFEKPKVEVGLSYSFFNARIENNVARKYPNTYNDTYSYIYDVYRPINIMTYTGIRSDQERLIQTYGGIKIGYWSDRMASYSVNQNDDFDTETIVSQLHYFALGPKFGFSVGKKVQFFLESEHFWLTKTKYTYRNFQRVSTILFGVKFNFKKKGTAANST